MVADQQFYLAEAPSGMLVGWARELARRGFATLAISPKGSVTRRPNIESWNLEGKLLTPYGRPQMGILVEETLRAARILAAREGVNPDRVGITPACHSVGMRHGMRWQLRRGFGRVRQSAAAWDAWQPLSTTGDIERHSAYFFIPHMLRYFDHPEVVAACMPPRPFMMVAPTQDEDMPRRGGR